jgi:tetratricopeptide (TPR) repeat protein
MVCGRMIATLFGVVCCAAPLHGQTYEELLARGDSLTEALQVSHALEAYQAAYRQRATHEATWKIAQAQIDVAKQLVDDRYEHRRDSLYGRARMYAELAIRTDSTDPEPHFIMSEALGRLSRTRGGNERVRFAREIYDEAAMALSLDSNHPGAHHVIGAWHAEIMRLSGVTKFFARTFLGAGFMSRASWDSAVVHLERSVALEPDYLFHHLELAQIYIDRERYADARRELQRVVALPPTSDVLDPLNKEEAARLLEEIEGKSE